MVCKICGENLTSMTDPETISITEEWKVKMKDMSCQELYGKYWTSYVYYIHVAARELLIERRHSEIEELPK